MSQVHIPGVLRLCGLGKVKEKKARRQFSTVLSSA